MKCVLAVSLLLVATAFAAPAEEVIDWSQVKPRYVEPVLPEGQELSISAEDLPHGRVTNGQLAERNQFPYQVGIMMYMEDGLAWCGGSVLSDRYVLTAAHCAVDLTTGVDIYFGAWNRLDKKEKGQQIIFVAKRYITVHENYDSDTITNDIAVIRLPIKLVFNEYIQPTVMPKKAETYSTFANQRAIASGWGRTSDSTTGATDKLQWIDVPIMSNSGCNTWYLGSIKGSNICIKTTGKISTCNGDSGGPLVLADTKEQIGLTSFGLKFGCELGFPGVFTRITYYLDWIEKNTGLTFN